MRNCVYEESILLGVVWRLGSSPLPKEGIKAHSTIYSTIPLHYTIILYYGRRAVRFLAIPLEKKENRTISPVTGGIFWRSCPCLVSIERADRKSVPIFEKGGEESRLVLYYYELYYTTILERLYKE